MEVPAGYWQDIRRNCATILDKLPVIEKWVAWPLVRTTWVTAGWMDTQNRPEVLTRFRDQVFSLIGRRLLVDHISHELTIPDAPYPVSLCFDPKNEELFSAFPAHGYPLYHGFKGVQVHHYDRLYDALARGAQVR